LGRPANNSVRKYILYRHFDIDGGLLYVGISRDFGRRQETHRRWSPWRKAISKITTEICDSEIDARLKERHAIETEYPHHNVIWNIHRGRSRRARFFALPPLPEDIPIEEISTEADFALFMGRSLDFIRRLYDRKQGPPAYRQEEYIVYLDQDIRDWLRSIRRGD